MTRVDGLLLYVHKAKKSIRRSERNATLAGDGSSLQRWSCVLLEHQENRRRAVERHVWPEDLNVASAVPDGALEALAIVKHLVAKPVCRIFDWARDVRPHEHCEDAFQALSFCVTEHSPTAFAAELRLRFFIAGHLQQHADCELGVSLTALHLVAKAFLADFSSNAWVEAGVEDPSGTLVLLFQNHQDLLGSAHPRTGKIR